MLVLPLLKFLLEEELLEDDPDWEVMEPIGPLKARRENAMAAAVAVLING